MSEVPPQVFYVGIWKQDGKPAGHIFGMQPPKPEDLLSDTLGVRISKTREGSEPPRATSSDFEQVFDFFKQSLNTYRNYIAFTLHTAPQLASAIAGETIGRYLMQNGRKRPDLSDTNMTVYDIPVSRFREFRAADMEATLAIEGALHLPEVMVMGLISVYDAFLTRLLRVILNKQPKIVLASDQRTIKVSQLSEYDSIEEARAALLDQEIEKVMRGSHEDQLEFLCSKKIWEEGIVELKESGVWPQFIELCERRNLLTHTGGIVSAPYLRNCKSAGCDVSTINVGDKLNVNSLYFLNAVDTIYQVGIKICHSAWRKYGEHELNKADASLNILCVDLLSDQAYHVAESLLTYALKTVSKRGAEINRRMVIINLANSKKLQGKKQESEEVLNSVDWTACSDDFHLCVEAVRSNVDNVISMMFKIGDSGKVKAKDYRSWPVFMELRNNEQFISAFEKIFNEPFIASKITQECTKNAADSESPGGDD